VKKVVEEAASRNSTRKRHFKRYKSNSDTDSDELVAFKEDTDDDFEESLRRYSMAFTKDSRVWAQISADVDAAVATDMTHRIE